MNVRTKAQDQLPSGIGPIELEVARYKLEGIVEEMQLTLTRSSYSEIVKEGNDCSTGLFTIAGESVAQALSIPILLVALNPVIEAILRKFPRETMCEDDLYIMNDPYHGGGHLPDLCLVMPVFHEGGLVAFTASLSHHTDIGGTTPGSMPTNATEIFHEGLRIPPSRLRRAGVLDDTLLSIMKLNSRLPTNLIGDLNGQIAACSIGARRLRELAAQWGDALQDLFKTLLDRSEALTRQALSAMPQGTYRATQVMDNDGVDLDRRIRVQVAVTIAGGEMTCDLTGTSAQVKGPFNCMPSGSLAAACFALRVLTDSTIPANGGCFRAIRLIIPEGSIVNPIAPAPVASRTAVVKRVTTAIIAALRPALPSKTAADPGSQLLILTYGGRRPSGEPWVVSEVVVGGTGACRDMDGIDVIESDLTNSYNIPIEALEARFPIRVSHYGLREGSGGLGEFRGGLGCLRCYELLDGPITFTHRGERHFVAPDGYDGGESGATAQTRIIRRDGTVEAVPSKIVTTLYAGDKIVVQTAGGGGWGPFSKRDPVRHAADLKSRKVV